VISHVIIGLKTVKGTKQLKLDPSIYDGLQKEKACSNTLAFLSRLTSRQVNVGDVIYIEANSGSVKRVGRCDAYSTEFDLEVRRSCDTSTHSHPYSPLLMRFIRRQRSTCRCREATCTRRRR